MGKDANTFEWQEIDERYQCVSLCNAYGGLNQRWQLIFSQPAYERELKTFKKRIKKARTQVIKASETLSKKVFNCEKDGQKAVLELSKKCRYHSLTGIAQPVYKHAGRGRPAKNTQPVLQGYHFEMTVHDDVEKQQANRNRLGRFILATNVLDVNILPEATILSEYKDQSKNEKGFRFLKDP